MINIIFEALIVGLYVYLLNYFIQLNNNLKNKYLFLFGFIKHLFAYFLFLHYYYCKYGYACRNIKISNKNLLKKTLIISIFEGLLFIFFGNLILPKLNYNYFIFGLLLHLFSEFVYIHTLFCLYSC